MPLGARAGAYANSSAAVRLQRAAGRVDQGQGGGRLDRAGRGAPARPCGQVARPACGRRRSSRCYTPSQVDLDVERVQPKKVLQRAACRVAGPPHEPEASSPVRHRQAASAWPGGDRRGTGLQTSSRRGPVGELPGGVGCASERAPDDSNSLSTSLTRHPSCQRSWLGPAPWGIRCRSEDKAIVD